MKKSLEKEKDKLQSLSPDMPDNQGMKIKEWSGADSQGSFTFPI